MNEPRAMPEAFFAAPGRGALTGVREGDHVTMCTSTPEVRQWLADSLEHVFRNVPGLGGVFTITASENLTNCASHGRHRECAVQRPVGGRDHRRSKRDDRLGRAAGEPLGQGAGLGLGLARRRRARDHRPVAKVGVAPVGERVVAPDPPRRRGFDRGRVLDLLRGARRRARTALGRGAQAGLRTSAKVQFNNTWELSAVPYLPVMDLVAEHAEKLATSGVDGLMLSWSLGGYPSPNLEIAQQFALGKASKEEVLDRVAEKHFGAQARGARRAWTQFSTAFREFPYHISVVYQAPMQVGPANLLWAKTSGYRATMVGFPYDDVNAWRGPYPAEVFAAQFAKVAEGWKAGLADLRGAADAAPATLRDEAQAQWRFAAAAQLHFASVANQTRFTIARNRLADAQKPPSESERKQLAAEMKQIVDDEARLALELFPLARADSRIGYEASNHYYYLPVDLMEKVLNCRWIQQKAAAP